MLFLDTTVSSPFFATPLPNRSAFVTKKMRLVDTVRYSLIVPKAETERERERGGKKLINKQKTCRFQLEEPAFCAAPCGINARSIFCRCHDFITEQVGALGITPIPKFPSIDLMCFALAPCSTLD